MKFDIASFLQEIEAALGPIEALIANHSTGQVHTAAVTAEALGSVLGPVINSLITSSAAGASAPTATIVASK